MTRAPTDPQPLPTTRSGPFDPPQAMGERGPISPLAFPDGHLGWLVTGHELNRSIFADPRFSARQELRRFPIRVGIAERNAQKPADPGMFLRMDPPDHTRYRRLLTGQFTVRRMNELRPRIEAMAAGLLDDLERGPRPADLVEGYALPIPSMVICELLGVPYAEREFFQGAARRALSLGASAEEAGAALAEIRAYLGTLARAKRREPTDDMLSGLAASGELTDEELAGMGLLLLIAGHETTANMLSIGTFALLCHPDQLAELRADPALVDTATEELLRYVTIIQFGTSRAALEDVEIGGVVVRAGQNVVLSLPSGNRDPERFTDPDRLDITRKATGHLAFGHGVHQCLGQQLARIEMRVGYAALLERFPTLRLAVAPEEVPLRTDMAIYGVHRLPVTW